MEEQKDKIGENLTPKLPSQDDGVLKNGIPSTDLKALKVEGRVVEALPNAFFRVELQDGRQITGFLSGKMRMNRIKILTGDKVTLEMSPYDDKKGRIVYRLK